MVALALAGLFYRWVAWFSAGWVAWFSAGWVAPFCRGLFLSGPVLGGLVATDLDGPPATLLFLWRRFAFLANWASVSTVLASASWPAGWVAWFSAGWVAPFCRGLFLSGPVLGGLVATDLDGPPATLLFFGWLA